LLSYSINKVQKLFKKTLDLGLQAVKSLSIIRLLADAATQQQAGAAKNSQDKGRHNALPF
jgi:hypothetical protein